MILERVAFTTEKYLETDIHCKFSIESSRKSWIWDLLKLNIDANGPQVKLYVWETWLPGWATNWSLEIGHCDTGGEQQ